MLGPDRSLPGENMPDLLHSLAFRQVLNSSVIEGSVLVRENMLLFVTKGSISFNHGEAVHNVGEQEFIFIRKNVLLQYRCVDSSFILFFLRNDLIIEFAKLAQLNPVSPPNDSCLLTIGESTAYLQTYLASLEPYLHCAVTMQESFAKIKLLELLFCLSENNHPVLPRILDIREQYHNDVTRVVEENITNALSLRQLAMLAGRSVSSFRRDFLSIYNMPPSRWIRQRKLEKAQELLKCTGMSVTNICYTLGFQSVAHFSRLFKSHFGYPPTDSRSNAMLAELSPANQNIQLKQLA